MPGRLDGDVGPVGVADSEGSDPVDGADGDGFSWLGCGAVGGGDHGGSTMPAPYATPSPPPTVNAQAAAAPAARRRRRPPARGAGAGDEAATAVSRSTNSSSTEGSLVSARSERATSFSDRLNLTP